MILVDGSKVSIVSSRSKKRASVTVNCVADKYHAPNERIVEFSFPDGGGGLISFSTLSDGTNIVQAYRVEGAKILPSTRNERPFQVEGGAS